jgi:protease-4
MKKILKFLLKIILTLCFSLITSGILLFILVIGVTAAFTPKPPTLTQNSVLVLDLNTNITDGEAANTPSMVMEAFLGGRQTQTLALWQIIDAIEAATTDDFIQALYLHGSLQPHHQGCGFATLRELRNAVSAFQSAGKKVYAHMLSPTLRDYYLCSIADHLTLDTMGMLFTPALGSEVTYWGAAFEKYGIGVQVMRTGKYKSWTEPFTEKAMSAENKEQLTVLLDQLSKTLLADIAERRSISVEDLTALAQEKAFLTADEAAQAGLISAAASTDIILDELKALVGEDTSGETFSQIDMRDYIYAQSLKPEKNKTADEIAVLYAEGEIVMGEGEYHNIGGDRLARTLRTLRHDDAIKAVVLRINSPGGSAQASEMIAREIALIQKSKPVVTSIGSVAASGGYWIAAPTDCIFAEPCSITGSIGVFGLKPNIQKLGNAHGVNWDSVMTTPFANLFSIATPMDPIAYHQLQSANEHVYHLFIDKVAQGRHLEPEYIETIAQGRVWTGFEAKKNGLIDELGGLKDAIAKAAELASISTWKLTHLPERQNFTEALAELFGEQRITPVSRGDWIGQITTRLENELQTLKSFNDPMGIYALLPFQLIL